jgi:hypothetical protein
MSKHLRIVLWTAAFVYIPTLCLAGVGVWFLGPVIEARYRPIIDPKTDRVENARLVGNDLCWDSHFIKLHAGTPVSVTRTLKITGRDVQAVAYIDAVARRVGGALSPYAPFADLDIGRDQMIPWCVRLPSLDFRAIELTSDWEYRVHRFWLTPQSRVPVHFVQSP